MSFFNVRLNNWCLHYGIRRIVVDVMFFQEILYICVVKFLSHVGLQIFRTFSFVSNYLCNYSNHFIFILGFEWYGTHTCLARQWRWECVINLCWIVYKDASQLHPPAIDHSIRKLWRVFIKKFFLPECAVPPSIAVFRLLFSSDIFDHDVWHANDAEICSTFLIYSMRWIVICWIIFLSSFNIICVLFWSFIIFFSISSCQFLKICMLCCIYNLLAVSSFTGSVTCQILHQSRRWSRKERYYECNFWVICSIGSMI